MPNKRVPLKNINTFGNKIDFIIDIFHKKFDRQSESYTFLQTKVSYLLAFVSLLIAGYLTVLFDTNVNLSCDPVFKILSILGLAGLIVCVILLLIAAQNRTFLDPPDTKTIYSDKAFNIGLDDLKNQVASDMNASFNKNLPQLVNVAKWLDRAMLTFILSLFLIAAVALFLPKCARIGNMTSDKSNPKPSEQPEPVLPSQSPGTPVRKSPVTPFQPSTTNDAKFPVSPSPSSGTALPFGEQSDFIKTIK